jgi:hypothetical protein
MDRDGFARMMDLTRQGAEQVNAELTEMSVLRIDRKMRSCRRWWNERESVCGELASCQCVKTGPPRKCGMDILVEGVIVECEGCRDCWDGVARCGVAAETCRCLRWCVASVERKVQRLCGCDSIPLLSPSPAEEMLTAQERKEAAEME